MKRWIFRLLTLSAIIFAAGISGAWLADQFTAPLPWAWGFFGAIIIGVAIYGGVALGTHGDRTGYLIAGLGAVAEITFGFWYFAHAHGIFTALVLGIVPTGIAIMSGLVENAADVMDAQAEQEAHERAWEREQARLRLDMEHAEKLARIEANAQARIEKARIDAESQTQPADAPPPTQHATRPTATPDRDERIAYLQTLDHALPTELAALWGYSDRMARKDLTAAGFSKNGGGPWKRA